MSRSRRCADSSSNGVVAVVGATGFVGSHLTKSLLTRGFDVIALKRDSASFCFPIHHPNLTVIDLESKEALAQAAQNWRNLICFFHLAASVDVAASLDDPEIFIHRNIEVTLRSVGLVRRYWPGTYGILLSSDRVFGKKEGLLPESEMPEPVDPYGISKSLSEEIISHFCGLDGTSASVVRASNLYGPFQRSKQFIPSIFRAFWRGQSDILVGDLDVYRSFLFISDLLDGLLAMTGARPETRAVGLSKLHLAGQRVQLGEVAEHFMELAAELFNRRVRILSGTKQVRSRSVELGPFELDCAAAAVRFGWRPTVNLRDGLKTIFKQEGRQNGVF